MLENFLSEAEVINRFNINPILFYNYKNKYGLEVNCKGEMDIFDDNFSLMISEIKQKQGKNISDFKEQFIYLITEIAKFNITNYFNILNIDPFCVISYYNERIDQNPYQATKTHIEQQVLVFNHIQLNLLHSILVFKEQMAGRKDLDVSLYDIDIEMVFSVFREQAFEVLNKSTKTDILKCFKEIESEIDRVHREYLKHLEIIN